MPAPTRFSQISPSVATLVLAVLVLALGALWWTATQMPPPVPDPEHGDLDTYAEVVALLRGGQSYHLALHDRLLAHGYGTLSVFNWRPPFFLSMLAALPSLAVAQAILVGLSGVGLGAACWLMHRVAGLVPALVLAVLLALSLIATLAPLAALSFELYAGALILLSASAYGLKLPWLGFGAAVLALFVRELVAPYVVICVILSWRDGRRRELLAWGAALVGYAVYFGWHAFVVQSLLGPDDHAYARGWVQFGGAAFVLATAAFNGIVLVLPNWVTAVLLPFAVLGLVAWPGAGRAHFLWTVLAYLALFAIIGRPANSYWGALFTPLLAPGLIFAPAAVSDLITALRRAPKTA